MLEGKIQASEEEVNRLEELGCEFIDSVPNGYIVFNAGGWSYCDYTWYSTVDIPKVRMEDLK